jgi:hypothetical protein
LEIVFEMDHPSYFSVSVCKSSEHAAHGYLVLSACAGLSAMLDRVAPGAHNGATTMSSLSGLDADQ